jgi:diacylglycerol kinase family enzyme
VLPVGTANLLAREVSIPLELEPACQLAVNGQQVRQLDAMQIGERLFFSRISIGVYSKITEKTSPAAKRYFRRIAYVWNALPELFGKRSWRFTLGVDGQVSHPHASSIMVANVGAVGAGDLRWGPGIAPDDGHVDICIAHGRSLWDYVVLGWHVLQHRHREAPKLVYLRAKRSVRISTRKRVPVRGDGEIIAHSAVKIAILPQALHVVTPEKAGSVTADHPSNQLRQVSASW